MNINNFLAAGPKETKAKYLREQNEKLRIVLSCKAAWALTASVTIC